MCSLSIPTLSSKTLTWLHSLLCGDLGGERKDENSYLIVFGNEQEHDHASSSSKSSVLTEKSKATRKLSSKSLEVSPPQQKDIKSSEHLTSPKKTDYGDRSNKRVDKVGNAIDETALQNLNSPGPAIKKSNTMSNGPAPRHRTTLGRTSVSKSLKIGAMIFFLFASYVFGTSLKSVKFFFLLILNFLS